MKYIDWEHVKIPEIYDGMPEHTMLGSQDIAQIIGCGRHYLTHLVKKECWPVPDTTTWAAFRDGPFKPTYYWKLSTVRKALKRLQTLEMPANNQYPEHLFG